MTNTSSSSSINFALLNQSINRYVPIPLMFFGTIGNILNIMVFTRKIFRNNICVAYFLASTIFNFPIIFINLLARVLYGFDVDPSQYSSILCKLKFFIAYFAGYTAYWFISLACVERYLSSSMDAHRRQLITMKRAYLSMIIVILMGFVIFGEQFYCIDINQAVLGAPQACYQLKQNIRCQIADSLLQFLFEIMAPVLVMIVFGSLILRNVHQKRRRINPTQTTNLLASGIAMTMATTRRPPEHQQASENTVAPNAQSSSAKVTRTTQNRETQLIIMLLTQVVIFIIALFPISVYKLYSAATLNEKKSILRTSIENTIFNISAMGLFFNNTITFYIYTLSGAIFRKELMKLFR